MQDPFNLIKSTARAAYYRHISKRTLHS